MKSSIDIQVGKKIRTRRIICGLSQAELAKKTSVSAQQIQKYEAGLTCLTVDKLSGLAEALSVDMLYFLTNLSEDEVEFHDNKKIFDYGNSSVNYEEMLKFIKEYKKIRNEMSHSIIDLIIKHILSAEQQKTDDH